MRHNCLNNTSFVYTSEVKVRLGVILSAEIRKSNIFVEIGRPPASRSSAMFVDIIRHLYICRRLNLD